MLMTLQKIHSPFRSTVCNVYKYGLPTNREVDSRPWNIWGQFVLGEPQVRTHKEMRLMLTQPLKV